MNFGLIVWILFFIVIGYFGYKRYTDKKKEHFEDRDN